MLDSVTGRGWIACGDAAMAFDPLSSQGIFNALYTGMKAGGAVSSAIGGDNSLLAAYGSRLSQIRAAYLQHRSQIYSSERRWPDAPFWKGIKAHES
jgi:flavin-dependent dehydrogenase